MLKKLFFLLAISGMLFACNSEKSDAEGHDAMTHEEEHEHGDASADTGDGKHFGETITPENALTFNQLVAEMESVDSMETKVVGTVTEVCQMKGCWMNVTADGKEEKLFVKFKDYGFFVPKDIAGRQVIMEGKAYREVTPVDELRHYAEDDGKSAEEIAAITEPKEELKFMASGVILLDPAEK